MSTRCLSYPVDATAIWLIGLYQRYLSPRKGFACAYRVLHRRRSCSEYIKRAFARGNAGRAVLLARRRFAACRCAYERLHSQKEEDREDRSFRPCEDEEVELCGNGTEACADIAFDHCS